MLFVVIARFRDGAEEKRRAMTSAFSDHLATRMPKIRLGGPLRSEQGQQVGVFYIAEANSREQVDAFVQASPYTKADMYETIEIEELNVEAGSLG